MLRALACFAPQAKGFGSGHCRPRMAGIAGRRACGKTEMLLPQTGWGLRSRAQMEEEARCWMCPDRRVQMSLWAVRVFSF
eukprot:1580760-Rhodomonas_salina.3